jgi:pimeloyl-ACP methyl ester carboxylesterase
MERMGLRRAVLVGHSLGCQVAIHAAAQDPELASRLVLIGPTADPAARTGLRQVLRGVRTGASERAGVTALGALDYARAGPDLVREEMELMVADAPEALLPRLTCPVAIIRGERDRIVPQHWAERLARESGGPDPIVVPGWGHAVHYDAPATVAAAIVGLQIPSERERRAATFVPEARP